MSRVRFEGLEPQKMLLPPPNQEDIAVINSWRPGCSFEKGMSTKKTSVRGTVKEPSEGPKTIYTSEPVAYWAPSIIMETERGSFYSLGVRLWWAHSEQAHKYLQHEKILHKWWPNLHINYGYYRWHHTDKAGFQHPWFAKVIATLLMVERRNDKSPLWIPTEIWREVIERIVYPTPTPRAEYDLRVDLSRLLV